MSGARARLAFSGLSPERLRRLEERHGGPDCLLAAVESDDTEIGVEAAAAVLTPWETRRRQLADLGCAVVERGGPGYPGRLEAYPDAPASLFVRGSIPTVPMVAIVGTRRCTAYGREVAASYGRALADVGIAVVSGLARGVDGAAHTGTVARNGLGVAVLGSGIDVAYPQEHRSLADRLAALGGAIVTEYPPGTTPEPWRFPLRNRIIAGLADAVVVVEAGVRGGALITAGKALEYGVPVFAVPGDVDRETSVGCNLLIRDGAHPVLDPADLVEELSLVVGGLPGAGPASAAAASGDH